MRLDDSPQRFEGKSRIRGSVTLAVLTYGLGLLRTGGDVTLPEGTNRFDVIRERAWTSPIWYESPTL